MNRLLPTVLLGLCASTAGAQTFCVGTDQELQSRLFQAHAIAVANPGASDVTIKLRRRPAAYLLASAPDSTHGSAFGKLQILGGYSDDPLDPCSANGRLLDAAATRIDVQAGWDIGATGNVLVQGLTIDVTGSFGLELQKNGNAQTTLAVESNIFIGGNPRALTMTPALQGVNAKLDYRVVNNVFTGAQSAAFCALDLLAGGPGGSAEIANNTFSANVGGGACIYRLDGARFDNNILWGNAQGIVDEDVAIPTPVTLVHNILQPSNTIPGLVGTHVGGLAVNPMFTPGTFRPATNSPAINSGAPGSVPGGLPELDLDGSARVVGSRVDRGAYESQLADDTEVIVVNTAIDTLDTSNGKMSLRSALLKANEDPGTETIRFDIGSPALCEARIVLASQLGDLPNILESVIIDGYSQGSATPNTLSQGFNANICVALIGNGAQDGLIVLNGSTNLAVRGVRFAGFDNAVKLFSGSGHSVVGNSFDPLTDEANAVNVLATGSATGVFIGGYAPALRNLLSGATVASVVLATSDNHVSGNQIGPKVDGVVDPQSRNFVGVRATGTQNTVDKNMIYGNIDAGVLLEGAGNTVSGNQFASNASGIRITGSDSLVSGNEIAYSFGAGVEIAAGAYKNRVSPNSIHDNQGLGIDINSDGVVNLNNTDVGFASTQGNRGQNFPNLLLAKNVAGNPLTTAQVQGVLDTGNGTFDVRFYASDSCDPSGNGEGQEAVGQASVVITNAGQFTNGSKGFSVSLASPHPLPGRMLTATATDATGNTSEFSACKLIDGPSVGIFRNGFE